MRRKKGFGIKDVVRRLPYCLILASLLWAILQLCRHAHRGWQKDDLSATSFLAKYHKTHDFSTCKSLTSAMTRSREQGSLLSVRAHLADQDKFLHEAMMNPSYGGLVTVSPNKTFSIFNNSTVYQQWAGDPELRELLPNKLVQMTLREFQERSKAAGDGKLQTLHFPQESYYFQGDPPADALKALKASAPLHCSLDAGNGWSLRRIKFRIASAGSRHVMHYDKSDTLLIQLSGTKSMTFIPKAQLSYLYPYPAAGIQHRRAQVDVEDPDIRRFPKSRFLTPFNITLQPGDFLFMPQQTGHSVRVLQDSTSLSLRMEFTRS